MSGGVDSSLAAARLVDAGYEVIGVTLHLWDYDPDKSDKGRCCAPEDQHDARRVADQLGVPHYTFDRRELFQEHVVGPFVDAYLEGRTPSPCVSCNRSVKLRELLPLADRLGAAYVATGHYARVRREPSGAQLLRGRDRNKDQSYFLYMLEARELERLLLPLGDALKDEVRSEASRRRLVGADKGESQELCFVQSSRYDSFVAERAGVETTGRSRIRPGPIVGPDGRVIGRHDGLYRFTVGQRKGLGVTLGSPAYVVRLDPSEAAVHVGAAGDLECSGALVDGLTLHEGVSLPLVADIQVRARHRAQPGRLSRRRHPSTGQDALILDFDEPVRAVAPGQIAVLYEGDRVLGGATIIQGFPSSPLMGDDRRQGEMNGIVP
jgi:tRNA-uridine 2-sulfurtransferase